MFWEYLAPRYPVNTGSQGPELPRPQGLCSEEEGGGGLGAGAGKVQSSHSFPGFGSINSLEIRIKAILTVLELKTPPKGPVRGKERFPVSLRLSPQCMLLS